MTNRGNRPCFRVKKLVWKLCPVVPTIEIVYNQLPFCSILLSGTINGVLEGSCGMTNRGNKVNTLDWWPCFREKKLVQKLCPVVPTIEIVSNQLPFCSGLVAVFSGKEVGTEVVSRCPYN
ncbi:unnamed protein product [Linum trigynum]|uniref:Uncharacterized protein n=1 Tax=Linum trigynum TaxID=586398 RepID=A0AAV2CQJ7_9ROSI